MAESAHFSSTASRAVTFRAALALIASLIVAAAACAPYARLAGPVLPGFNAAFAAGVFIAEMATAFLLLVTLRQTGRRSALFLAQAYFYSTLMAAAYMLAYPDAIEPGRRLIGGPQTISWIYDSWIFGFGVLVFAAVWVEFRPMPPLERDRAKLLGYGSNAATALLVILLVIVFSTGAERLPALIVGDSWTAINAIFNYGGILFFAAAVLVIALGRQRADELFLWLAVALVTLTLGNALSAYGGGRYTIGWYACRLSWLGSSVVLLLYFLGQFVRQHSQLVRTTGDLEKRTRERDRIWSVSDDLLGVSTFDGYFVATNPAWTRMLGWEDDEIRRLHVDQLRHPDDAGTANEERARMAAGAPGARMINRFRRKDGSWRWISWSMTADQGLIYVAGRDVTAEREAQDALRTAEADAAHHQKMEALGQLTGGVAHDFNNLLMIVSGFIPRLRSRVQGDVRAQEAVQAIEIAAQRGTALTRQLLSFSRRQPINPVAIKVGERIVALRTLLSGPVGPLISLRIDAAAEVWPVTVDANEFELALLNLVLNARDAMGQDGSITVAARNVVLQGNETAKKLSGEFVAVSVSDSGQGIAPEILAKVFDPFFTTKKGDKGTGLGLSQVHGFSHQSAGTVAIDSTPGSGTTVTIYLPRTPAVPKTAAPAPASSTPGGTALLVEDNPDVAEVGREMLDQLGFSVRVAVNARDALQVLQGEKFDLVMSDIVMPGGMNGIELARQIRAKSPAQPILLVTGYTGTTVAATDFVVLRKPYRFEQLRQAIAGVMGETRTQRDVA